MEGGSMNEMKLMQALQLACSQNLQELKIGEEQLNAWKREKGFYCGLAGVFTNRSVEAGVRWMALTCVKNGVDQFWRPGAPDGISDEEKAVVRTALLQCIEEPVPQVSTQLSVLIARIARLDCPGHWPELLPVLTEGVRNSSEDTRKCFLNTMKHVIKSLAGRRLVNHRKVFCDITTQLFVYLVKLWNTHLQEGVAQLSGREGNLAVDTLEMARVCLKILRQMIVHGFPKFYAIIEALRFVRTLLERIPELIQLRSQLPDGHEAKISLEENINLKMKIIIEVHSHHPIGFAPFVLTSLELIYGLVFSTERAGQLYEKFVIKSLTLFWLILRCEDYNPPKYDLLTESALPPGIMEAHQAKLSFFKASVCQQLLERLVGHYLLLTDEDLLLWEDNPEEFVKEQPGDTHSCSLRHCVESALVALVHEFQLTLAPSMLALLQKVQTIDSSADTNSLRIKEAVFNAVGLCAFELYDELDYDSWYQTQLIMELSIRDPWYKIVRHRVVWLLGQWVTVKMSPSLRPSLYSVVVPLLLETEDMAVRLAAAEVIRICTDDLDFDVEHFAPFLSDCVRSLFQLLHQLKEVDTKMKVLNILSLLTERVGPAIQPHVDMLLQALPSLWEESGDKNSSMLRSIIVCTLTNITKGLGRVSVGLHDITLPVIQLATDVKQIEHVYLAEDGLLLWLTTLQHTSSPSPALMQLITNMVGLLGLEPPSDESTGSMSGLMDIGSEGLLICFRIFDVYTVLCSLKPEYFLESCSDIIVRACQYYLCDVKPEGVVIIINLISRVVEVYSSHFPNMVEPLLPVVLRKLLEEEDYPPTTSAYLALIGRVLVHQPTFFFTFLEKMCSQAQQTAAELFGLIVDTWSVRLDSVTSTQCRKLTGLAIANLLPVADVCVTSRFDSLVSMCVDVLHDVMDTTEDNKLFDILVTGQDEKEEEDVSSIDTEHDKREKRLSQFDPMRTIPLHEHFTSKLEQCLLVHGTAVYSTLINKVDVVIREQLLEFVPLKVAGQLLGLFLPTEIN